jgi:D-cysteine desulfhydrase/L-cysteate sulfo-lyase
VINTEAFVGSGYGIPSEAGDEAVRLFAHTEGIILDPIYTGKAAAGLIAHLRDGRFGRDDVLVFVHTGGTPANFTWSDLWIGEPRESGRSPAGTANS